MKKLLPTNPPMPEMPPVSPRQPLDDSRPSGYLESDLELFERNRDAFVWLMENHKAIRAALPKPILDRCNFRSVEQEVKA